MAAARRATYDDVLAAPEHVVAEVVDGVLHTQPRPAFRHAQAASALGEELGPPFKRGRGGPGGWIILDEPELHLGPGPDILVPDLAGWRRTTLPEVPDAPFTLVRPDWIAEVLSPSTRKLDKAVKLPIYQREAVAHVWLVDPDAQLLEMLRLDGASYRIVQTLSGNTPARAEPFDAIEFDVGALWQR